MSGSRQPGSELRLRVAGGAAEPNTRESEGCNPSASQDSTSQRPKRRRAPARAQGREGDTVRLRRQGLALQHDSWVLCVLKLHFPEATARSSRFPLVSSPRCANPRVRLSFRSSQTRSQPQP